MRSEQSQWSLSPYQRYCLVLEVWQEAKKLTRAGYGNIRIAMEKPHDKGGEDD